LQYPNVGNVDNLSNVRREGSRHFRNRKTEYLKDKINELESNSNNKYIRDLSWGINKFKEGYQSRTRLVKDKKGDLLVDPHKTVNRWMNYFCQLFNVQRVGCTRQIGIQTFLPSLASLRLRLLLES
jgi:hypothetical protein